MKTTALLLISITAAAAGCNPPSADVAASESAVKTCPPDGCAPPDPGDPPPTKPPRPPQPDPTKLRTAYISAAYIQNALNTLLYQTRLDLSNTGGDSIWIPSIMKSCTPTGKTPEEVQECIDDCNTEPMLTPAQRAQCRNNCPTTTTCVDVCSGYSTTSFLQWGDAAKQASLNDSPRSCNSATCPACATPTNVPSLDDRPLSIGPFTQSYDLGLGTIDITCTLNKWVFQVVNRNITVDSTPVALYVTIPGTTGWPALDCTNSPDPIVDGLALNLKFAFPWAQSTVVTDASLAGNWHVLGSIVDYIADMSGRISDAVTSNTHDMLNQPWLQKTLWDAFGSITAQYAKENTGETFDRLAYIESQYGQLKVTYLVK